MAFILIKTEKDVQDRFDSTSRQHEGKLESMQAEIDELQNAVSHLCGFIANHFRLTQPEIEDENGLTDF